MGLGAVVEATGDSCRSYVEDEEAGNGQLFHLDPYLEYTDFEPPVHRSLNMMLSVAKDDAAESKLARSPCEVHSEWVLDKPPLIQRQKAFCTPSKRRRM